MQTSGVGVLPKIAARACSVATVVLESAARARSMATMTLKSAAQACSAAPESRHSGLPEASKTCLSMRTGSALNEESLSNTA